MSIIQRILGGLHLFPVMATACPLCDSPAATELREALAETNTLGNTSAMLLPFAVLLAGLRFYRVGLRGFFKVNRNSGNEDSSP